MRILLLILGGLAAALALFVLFRLYRFKQYGRRMTKQRQLRLSGLIAALQNGKEADIALVHAYAADPRTRRDAHDILVDHDQIHLFPTEFNTTMAAAEGALTNWLEFPTELGCVPDEMEHVRQVPITTMIGTEHLFYEVFRYRMREPHWAAKTGWTIGVAGPFTEGNAPYGPISATFSRGCVFSEEAVEREVQWVHAKIFLGHPATSGRILRAYEPKEPGHS